MGNDDFEEQLRLRAQFLAEQGLGYVLDRPSLHPGPEKRAVPPRGSAAGPASGAAARRENPPEQKGTGMSEQTSSEFADLEAVRAELGDCRRCRLCEKRTNIVFGVGNPEARVMFIGEGPGADEDAQGIPFVGRAGKLLTDIITKGMGLSREDVYIANVVKCRPPNNRDPEADEMSACMPFLEAQIAVIHPDVIVALGRVAVQALMGHPVQITKFRGQWTNFKGVALMPTFHPSYLLRNPSAKRQVWEDIQAVMARLDLPMPDK